MNKTIKVIDLLNKIASGEIKEGQRFIIHFKEGLTRDIFYRGWESEKTSISSLRYYSDNNVVQDEYDLNDIVEIIEEEPEIDIQGIENVARITFNFPKDAYTPKQISDNFETMVELLNMQSDKQNEIVKAVKQLDRQINNK